MRQGLPAGRASANPSALRGIKGEPVAIGRLERFAADWYLQNCDEAQEKPASNGHKVGDTGRRPRRPDLRGRTWRSRATRVTVFEAFHAPGGVLIYGHPRVQASPRRSLRMRSRSSRRSASK